MRELRLFIVLPMLAALMACRGTETAPPTRSGGPVATASDEPQRSDLRHLHLDRKGLALAGYDPVSYFPEGGGKPRKGSPQIALTLQGVTWRFASEEHRARFQAAPARFEPAYGGWCAWAMVAGEKVEVDPRSFLVQDGRLLLFYKSVFTDTRKQWLEKGAAALRPEADAAWKRIQGPRPPQPKGG